MSPFNLVLPYSSLFNKLPQQFIDTFNTIERKSFDNYLNISKDTIFHSDLSLLDDNFLYILNRLKVFEIISRNRIKRFSFDIGPCFRRYEIRNNKYYGIGDRLNKQTIYQDAVQKIKYIKQNIPSYCSIAIENLNYYRTGAYEFVCDPDLYNSICTETQIELVLDIAHVQVSAHNMGMDLETYSSQFLRKNISEIHLSKIRINDDGEALDAHEAPDFSEFGILLSYANEKDRIYDVVIEYYRDTETLIHSYSQLRQVIKAESQ